MVLINCELKTLKFSMVFVNCEMPRDLGAHNYNCEMSSVSFSSDRILFSKRRTTDLNCEMGDFNCEMRDL